MEILQSIVSLYDTSPTKSYKRKKSNKKEQAHDHTMLPRAYFDGATQNNSCGCGVHIIMDEKLQYLISWNGGNDSNCKAEAMTLAGLLTFCLFFNIECVTIFGDSKVMVDYVLGKNHISDPHLAG